ncbi:MAG: hypothetical protein IPM21_14925 [Acidobacteria bacterium]|nr:hypothetical protein [Acidobacteriota bacterium]
MFSGQYFIDVLKPRADLVRRFAFVLIIAVSLFGSTLGQETPKAVLFDEFGDVQCGDLLARLDAFIVELQNNPGDRGYVLISEANRNPRAFQRMVEASIFTRRFDRERISIVLVGNEMGSENQFWRVPLGADAPAFKPIALPEPDLTKPFRYGGEHSETICPTFSLDLFAKLILDNPGSMARVVIVGPTVSSRLQTAKDVRETFERYTKLPADRISFYYVHRKEYWLWETEYWFIPAKRR